MPQINSFVESIRTFLDMGAEDRAHVLLRFIIAHPRRVSLPGQSDLQRAFPHARYLEYGEFESALREAVQYLEREQIIQSDDHRDFYTTARAWEFMNDTPGHIAMLEREALDPELAGDVAPSWRRRDFTRAVGIAFLAVELRVRKLAAIGDQKIDPQALMGKVFGDGGALRHPGHDVDKASSVRALFQAAMGRYRNPHLHDSESVKSADRALRLLQFADLLLSTAEQHAVAVKPSA